MQVVKIVVEILGFFGFILQVKRYCIITKELLLYHSRADIYFRLETVTSFLFKNKGTRFPHNERVKDSHLLNTTETGDKRPLHGPLGS